MRLAIALWLVLISVPASAQLFIGSGGEGVVEGNRVFLRDLYERDLHRAPWFGTAPSAPIEAGMASFRALPLTTAQGDLLGRKLADAERIFPCFGEILLNTLKLYTWTFEDHALGLLPEEDVIRHFEDDRRVQIANRLMTTIHIDRAAWNRLPDAHKVALLIHEALYGLSPVSRISFRQNLALTRELTAGLFTESVGSREKLIRSLLELAPGEPLCARDSRLDVVTRTADGGFRRDSLTPADSAADRAVFFRKACSWTRSFFPDDFGTYLYLKLARPFGLRLKFEEITPRTKQYVVRRETVLARSAVCRGYASVELGDSSDCRRRLERDLRETLARGGFESDSDCTDPDPGLEI